MTGSTEELNSLLVRSGLEVLESDQIGRFHSYLELLIRWNERMNLTAVRDPASILRRHFLECIACAYLLPQGIETVLDLGSGAGLPGIPIAICRPELLVTLAESQTKKSAFLNEVVRTLGVSARVFSGRAEELADRFDCVALRAVDRMSAAVRLASNLTVASGWMAVMSTTQNWTETVRGTENRVEWQTPVSLSGSDQRVLVLGRLR